MNNPDPPIAYKLDKKDFAILKILEDNSRSSMREIAKLRNTGPKN